MIKLLAQNTGGSTDAYGDLVDLAGIPLAGGGAAIVTIAATSVRSTVAHTTGGVQLLAADPARLAAVIVNTADTALHVQVAGQAEIVIAAGASASVANGVASVVNAWWEGTPTTGGAAIQTITI